MALTMTSENQLQIHTDDDDHDFCAYTDEDDVIAAAPASRCVHASIAHALCAAKYVRWQTEIGANKHVH